MPHRGRPIRASGASLAEDGERVTALRLYLACTGVALSLKRGAGPSLQCCSRACIERPEPHLRVGSPGRQAARHRVANRQLCSVVSWLRLLPQHRREGPQKAGDC